MTEPVTSTPAGWYHADGDPEGSVRWWDGRAWTTPPGPPPSPGAATSPPTISAPVQARAVTTGRRLWAAIFDALLWAIPVVVIAIIEIGGFLLRSIVNFSGREVDEPNSIGPTVVLLLAGYLVALAVMTAFGFTPGKLLTSLRVVAADGGGRPGPLRALRRVAPLGVGLVPGLMGNVFLLVAIAALVSITIDDDQRSLFDHIAGTRVVSVS